MRSLQFLGHTVSSHLLFHLMYYTVTANFKEENGHSTMLQKLNFGIFEGGGGAQDPLG